MDEWLKNLHVKKLQNANTASTGPQQESSRAGPPLILLQGFHDPPFEGRARMSQSDLTGSWPQQ